MSVRLLRSASTGLAFLELAERQLEKATAIAEDFARDPGDRIHDVRKRSKRLRALFRLAQPDLPDYRRLDRAVSDAAQGLARMRDARVLRETLNGLYEWAGRADRVPPAEPNAGSSDEQTERSALATFAGNVRAIAASSAHWRVRRLDRRTLVEGLTVTYRKSRKARRKAEKTGDPIDYHRWRKHAKYHWNQLVFLKKAAPDILPSLAKAAKELTEILGTHHDLAVLREALGKDPKCLGADVDVGFVEEAAAARQRELAALAARVADQIFAEKPKAFSRRFAAYAEEHATPAEAAAE